MDSRLVRELKLQYEPVAILLMQEKPPTALEGKEGCWSCVIPLFIAAAKGKTAVFSRSTTGCTGGKAGLGFGNAYVDVAGDIEYFLSTGREGCREGEGYIKTPELARDFIDNLPMVDIPAEYVVFMPLSQVDLQIETPLLVAFYVNVDQLSALTVLANYGRHGNEHVMIPFGAGCQNLFLLPYREAQKEQPKAVIGMVDITVRPMVDQNRLTFTVPFGMFNEMEDNVAGSFLEKHLWRKIAARRR